LDCGSLLPLSEDSLLPPIQPWPRLAMELTHPSRRKAGNEGL